MNYGYCRVSSRMQHEDRQLQALKEAGVEIKKVFVDKCSGKNFDRDGYRRMIRRLKRGDAVFVKSIDRLGRNYTEILEQWEFITKEKGADIVVLDMALLDTRQNKDLTGTLISDIVLQLLSYVAETERHFIKSRQREGIRIAKEKGVRFGRRPKERPDLFWDLKNQYEHGEVTAREAAGRLGIAHSTFLAWTKTSK